MSIEELSIEQKNKLITEKILGECFCEHKKDEWSAMEMDSCYPDACDKCDKLMRGNRNFYEGDRSYKDIADALAFCLEQFPDKYHPPFIKMLYQVIGLTGWAFMGGHDRDRLVLLSTPPQKADALVAMILETKQ